MPRILAIDYGFKRKICTTDELQIIASGFNNNSFRKLRFFKDYFSKEKVVSAYMNQNKQS
jgi:hypothetical protein